MALRSFVADIRKLPFDTRLELAKNIDKLAWTMNPVPEELSIRDEFIIYHCEPNWCDMISTFIPSGCEVKEVTGYDLNLLRPSALFR